MKCQRHSLIAGILLAAWGPTLLSGQPLSSPEIAPPAPQADDTAWGAERNGLQVGLVFLSGHRPYRIGETVTVAFKVRNVSNGPIPFQYHILLTNYNGDLELVVNPAQPGDAISQALAAQPPAAYQATEAEVDAALNRIATFIQDRLHAIAESNSSTWLEDRKRWEQSCAALPAGAVNYLAHLASRHPDASLRQLAVIALGCTGRRAGKYPLTCYGPFEGDPVKRLRLPPAGEDQVLKDGWLRKNAGPVLGKAKDRRDFDHG